MSPCTDHSGAASLVSIAVFAERVRAVEVGYVGVVLIDRDDHIGMKPSELPYPAREPACADAATGRRKIEDCAMVERKLAVPHVEDSITVQGIGDKIRILQGEFSRAYQDFAQVR